MTDNPCYYGRTNDGNTMLENYSVTRAFDFAPSVPLSKDSVIIMTDNPCYYGRTNDGNTMLENYSVTRAFDFAPSVPLLVPLVPNKFVNTGFDPSHISKRHWGVGLSQESLSANERESRFYV